MRSLSGVPRASGYSVATLRTVLEPARSWCGFRRPPAVATFSRWRDMPRGHTAVLGSPSEVRRLRCSRRSSRRERATSASFAIARTEIETDIGKACRVTRADSRRPSPCGSPRVTTSDSGSLPRAVPQPRMGWLATCSFAAWIRSRRRRRRPLPRPTAKLHLLLLAPSHDRSSPCASVGLNRSARSRRQPRSPRAAADGSHAFASRSQVTFPLRPAWPPGSASYCFPLSWGCSMMFSAAMSMTFRPTTTMAMTEISGDK